jgi:hypothetical protein
MRCPTSSWTDHSRYFNNHGWSWINEHCLAVTKSPMSLWAQFAQTMRVVADSSLTRLPRGAVFCHQKQCSTLTGLRLKGHGTRHVLTAVSIKNTIFWDVTPYSRVQVHRSPLCLLPTYCWWLASLILENRMDAVPSSETSVNFYRTKRRHIPEDRTIRYRSACWLLLAGYLLSLLFDHEVGGSKFLRNGMTVQWSRREDLQSDPASPWRLQQSEGFTLIGDYKTRNLIKKKEAKRERREGKGGVRK